MQVGGWGVARAWRLSRLAEGMHAASPHLRPTVTPCAKHCDLPVLQSGAWSTTRPNIW